MTRVLLVVMIAVLASACGGGERPPATSGNVDLAFTSQPDPPVVGENTFEVAVTQGGQPITDADVSVEFFMPAMPQMNMAEMRTNAALTHEGAGRYRGAGTVMMAGNWDVTIRALRGGQELGSRKLTVTAK